MEASFAAEAAAEAELVAGGESACLSPPLEKPPSRGSPRALHVAPPPHAVHVQVQPSALPPIDSETVEDNTTEDDYGGEVADFDSKDDGSGAGVTTGAAKVGHQQRHQQHQLMMMKQKKKEEGGEQGAQRAPSSLTVLQGRRASKWRGGEDASGYFTN